MNSDDTRGLIWSYLKDVPEPLSYKAKIMFNAEENFNFGDLYQNEDTSSLYIFNKLMKFENILFGKEILVPISITKDIINAVEFFEELIYYENLSIELRNDDLFIKTYFGNLPFEWKYKYINYNSVPALNIYFNDVNREKIFEAGIRNYDDIKLCHNNYKLKQTRFYIHLTIEDGISKLALSNYKNIYDQNYFEFYNSKDIIKNHTILSWANNLIKDSKLPIYWESTLIKYYDDPTYVLIEITGPLYERQNILSIIKREFSSLNLF